MSGEMLKSGEAVVVNVGDKFAFADIKTGTGVGNGPLNSLFIQPSSLEEIGRPAFSFPSLFDYLKVGDVVRFEATYQQDVRTKWKAKDSSVVVIKTQNKGQRPKPIEGLGLITFIDNDTKKYGFIQYEVPGDATTMDIWFGAWAIHPPVDDISLAFSINDKVRFRAVWKDPQFESSTKPEASPKCGWRAICVVAKHRELHSISDVAMQSLSSRSDFPSLPVTRPLMAAVKWGQDRLVTDSTAFFDEQGGDGSESSSPLQYSRVLRQALKKSEPSKNTITMRKETAKKANANPFSILDDSSSDSAGNSEPETNRSTRSAVSKHIRHTAAYSNGDTASGVLRRPPPASAAHTASVDASERPMGGEDHLGLAAILPLELQDRYRPSKESQQLTRIAHRFCQVTEDNCRHCQF